VITVSSAPVRLASLRSASVMLADSRLVRALRGPSVTGTAVAGSAQLRHHVPMPWGDKPPVPFQVAADTSTVLDAVPATLAERSSETTGAPANVERLLPSGDQAGTPPDDRAFRPDIQGMRAVAVLLVVLVHAQVKFLLGGFIGVDVFFVISGFVITGVLLRERSATGKTNILAFYGRRARRIIPAAILVIVVTVIAEQVFVGASAAEYAASEARWASAFLANFPHNNGNFFTARPNPLGAYWSLAVEEQFYLVYPMLLVIAATLARRFSLRVKLGVLLGVILVVSFAWSVISSPGAGTVVAYASPFTHAWELALGGLLAVGTGSLRRLPLTLAAVMSWVGLVAIVMAAVVARGLPSSGYPGYAAAVPVGATALIIAGGTAAPRWGAEALLRLAPFKWLGLWSFSIYLWHYPILIVAAQHWGHAGVTTNLLLAAAAVALSAGTYFVIENPIRHWSFLTRFPWVSVAAGAGLVLGGLAIVDLAG
jgi:peptidoglycan/LPS O-acetylase OafA/YrhL